ncbi:MAG TPA: flagellar motor protein [Methylomirabilota bacterium]|nr:flagellar motor protein [Methylomirabilota bacterium]
MDFGTLLGVGVGLGAILASVLLEGGYLGSFLNLSAFVIIFGGTLGATTISVSLAEIKRLPELLKKTFKINQLQSPAVVIESIVALSQKARREGILSLQDELEKTIRDQYLANGLQLVIDGADETIVREVLRTEIERMRQRHRNGANTFQTMGGYAPTMGIIGTVMGLVHVMQGLGGSMEELGKGVALAFVATLYGILSANLIFLPIAGNLKAKSEEEVFLREVMLEGVLGIQAGQNPFILDQRLRAYFQNLPEPIPQE